MNGIDDGEIKMHKINQERKDKVNEQMNKKK